jgi:hypothetical protein
MNGGAFGRAPLLGAWLGIGLAWGALAVLATVLEVEPRIAVLVVLSLGAVGAAIVAWRRHWARGRRPLITTGDLRRK